MLSKQLYSLVRIIYRTNGAYGFKQKRTFYSSCTIGRYFHQKSLNRPVFLVGKKFYSTQQIGKIDGKFYISFTCKPCGNKVSKLISKLAYERGVVIIKCDSCKNNHLIADNLGWFPDQSKNIEEILKSKGEEVRKTLKEGESISIEIPFPEKT